MNTLDPTIAADARAVLNDYGHYAEAILAMAGAVDLRTRTDIVAPTTGTTVPRGTPVDATLATTLRSIWHSGGDFEDNLSIEAGVTAETLGRGIQSLLMTDPWLKQLAARAGAPSALLRGVLHLKLPRMVLFRLTVAQQQRKQIYAHTLHTVVISQYLALRANLTQDAIDDILMAALCHDLGELYTPPAILDPRHRVNDEERRFIYVHPVTGWLQTRDLPGISADVSRAILQHHERLDGSGYPEARKGKAIGLAARILGIADVATSIMATSCDYHRLSTLLRLTHLRYDQRFVNLLHDTIAQEAPPLDSLDRDRVVRQLTEFSRLLDGWSRLYDTPILKNTAPISFLSERIYNLRTTILEFGFDPDSLHMPLALAAEDAAIAAEIIDVLDELRFQLADLRREIARHLPAWQPALLPSALAAFTDWYQQLTRYVQNQPPV
jgi:HD-GYP domain-containing protein (c-di-GMP phosphodiesterase class II)